MDTQPSEAVANDGTAPVEASADPAAYFEQLATEEFGLTDDEQDEAPAESEEGEEPAAEEAEDETDDEAEADDLPPIDPPVSWDAEAKAKFAELPRDLQETVQKREAERERFVQTKSQEATRAQQEARQAALSELAQIEQGYSQHFQTLAEQLMPQRPNPALLQHDPQAFYAQQANYETAIAQQRELQQQSQQYAQQAQMRQAQIEQAEHAEQARIITEQFPEYADPTTGPELQRKLTAVAKRLGYPDELISQARATDILAMRNVAEALDKADKYDALMKDKMAKVRAAKGKPPVTARPGVAQGADALRARNAQSALEKAKTARNVQDKGAAFYEYLQSTGQI